MFESSFGNTTERPVQPVGSVAPAAQRRYVVVPVGGFRFRSYALEEAK
jgi:hypothetical protein